MAEVKRILFPLNGNESALDFAIDIAKKAKARLYILHTYRLIDLHKKHAEGKNKSIIRDISESVEKDFKEKYEEKLMRSGVNYEFMIEIGFLIDRIIANIREKNIDMLLMEKDKMDQDETMKDRFSELKIEVVLIPEAAEDA